MSEKDFIEEIFNGFQITEEIDSKPVQRAGVTIWLPEDYREKFLLLQSKSKRRFGKKVQELVIKAIDKVFEI